MNDEFQMTNGAESRELMGSEQACSTEDQRAKELATLCSTRVPRVQFGVSPNWLRVKSSFASEQECASRIQAGRLNRPAGRGCYTRRLRNSAQALATSGAFKIADTTQILRAPAASTSSRFCKLIPPMANHGTVTLCAAQRT